ncbi:MAG: DUF5658 family protein [Pseudomonadota bacterium]
MLLEKKSLRYLLFEYNETFIKYIRFLLIFNLLDGIFTTLFIELGVATEANPIMNALYNTSPITFMFGKIILMMAGCYLLHKNIAKSLAKLAVILAFGVYSLIIIYHLLFLQVHIVCLCLAQ